MFQDFRLLDHLSAFDNVALPLRVAGAPEQRIRENVTELLEWVGLADKINARPPTLSGGQQQRIAIARAVIARPQLLLADEPTGNVDDAMALRLLRLFEEMNRLGTTIVLATHNEALATRLGHPRLHLVDGELAGAPRRSPHDPPAAGGYSAAARRHGAAAALADRADGLSRGLAIAAMLALGGALQQWDRGLAGTMTVELPARTRRAMRM